MLSDLSEPLKRGFWGGVTRNPKFSTEYYLASSDFSNLKRAREGVTGTGGREYAEEDYADDDDERGGASAWAWAWARAMLAF